VLVAQPVSLLAPLVAPSVSLLVLLAAQPDR
jgi:hypothetical protein